METLPTFIFVRTEKFKRLLMSKIKVYEAVELLSGLV